MSNLRVQRELSIPITCTECGESLTLTAPRWSRLSDLHEPEHECAPAAPVRVQPVGTARTAEPDLAAFVAEHIEPGHVSMLGHLRGANPLLGGGTEHVELTELHDLFEEQYGKGWGSGMFGRKLREVLPQDVDIRREMINGDRARRIIGMRWRNRRQPSGGKA
jgi:hypothetical protein